MPVCIPKNAGKTYRPSNGTEGDMFYAQNCARCIRGSNEDELCTIYGNAMFNDIGDADYPSEWRYDDAGCPECTAFVAEQNNPPQTEQQSESAS